MATGLSGNLTGILDKGLQESFLGGIASADQDLSWARFFKHDGITFNTQEVAPPSGYQTGVEADDIVDEAVEETYATTIQVAIANLGYSCSGLVRDTMPRETLMALYAQLGALGVRFFAAQLANLLNLCTVTAGGDGQPLASAAHPSGVGAMSNFLNSALGFTSWAAAVRALRECQNHRGMVMGLRPTKLILPPALDVTAGQVLGAPNSANDISQINVYQGMGVGRTILPELTSATRWFVLDESISPFRVPVVRGQDPWVIERHQDNGNYIVRDQIYSGAGHAAWRGVVVG